MSFCNILAPFTRLCLTPVLKPVLLNRNISGSSSLYFRTTPCLLGEPLKKKRRLDPAVLKAREERKKKKIEKQIRKLEKSARQLKPIEECEVSLSLLDEKKQRSRDLKALNSETLEERALLEKQWARFKNEQHLKDLKMLDRIAFAQQQALDELQKESEELYQEAVQADFQLLPITLQGPLYTPPIKDFDPVDGDYLDVSKKWDP